MSWNKLTRHQQNLARRLSTRLFNGGVTGCTVSQVAKYLDDAQQWDDGTLTLAELCQRTGWTAPAPAPAPAAEPEPEPEPEPIARPDHLTRIADRAAHIKALQEQLDTERAALRDDITAADQAGEGRNAIARAAADGLSRPRVYEHLGTTDIAGLAHEAIAAAELGGRYYAQLTTQGGQVRMALHGPADTGRIRNSQELEHQLNKRGLYMRLDGAKPPVEIVGEGDETDVVSVEKL